MINKIKYKELLSMCEKNDAQLIAVSKTKPISIIKELYDMGHRAFGENKVQELIEKSEQLPKDIEWHLIGHLQTNKVKKIVPIVKLIHAVDSLKLIKEINKEATKNDLIIEVLIQIAIAKEDTKFGIETDKLDELLNWYNSEGNLRVKIIGFMGMATYTFDDKIVNDEFNYLKNLFDKCKIKYDLDESFKEISMGMSGDYEIALKNGSTMVRIGSSIFGSR